MATVGPILHGVIRGRTIELTEDAGLPDGEKVEIYIRPATQLADNEPPRTTAAGMLQGIAGLDDGLEEIYRYRQRGVYREDAE